MVDLSFVTPLVGTIAGIGVFGAFMNSCYKKAQIDFLCEF